jgi:hypothetical protein
MRRTVGIIVLLCGSDDHPDRSPVRYAAAPAPDRMALDAPFLPVYQVPAGPLRLIEGRTDDP